MRPGVAAFSLIELVFALGLAATLSGIAIPEVLAAVDDLRAAGAARYIAAHLQRARMDAIKRNGATALRFEIVGGHYSFTPYLDGNGNGVLSREILSGIDAPLRPAERLIDQFPGVDLAAVPGLPPVDPSGVPPGADPVRLGAGNLATFTPIGTATSGSLYVRGRRNAQYVVRILGETGRTRVLRFNHTSRTWTPLGGT